VLIFLGGHRVRLNGKWLGVDEVVEFFEQLIDERDSNHGA